MEKEMEIYSNVYMKDGESFLGCPGECAADRGLVTFRHPVGNYHVTVPIADIKRIETYMEEIPAE